MPNTEKLKDMLDNLVNGKPEVAQVAFHDYLRGKLTNTMNGEADGKSSVPMDDITTKE